jgi:hypothetical protein
MPESSKKDSDRLYQSAWNAYAERIGRVPNAKSDSRARLEDLLPLAHNNVIVASYVNEIVRGNISLEKALLDMVVFLVRQNEFLTGECVRMSMSLPSNVRHHAQKHFSTNVLGTNVRRSLCEYLP